MLAFIVPIKSKTISADWTLFSSLVNRCISSICNQHDTNFKIYVSCHELPQTDYHNDDRVEFLQVDFAPPILDGKPSDYYKKELDKTKKIQHAVEHAKKDGIAYVMTVDGDDCISNKISGFVNEHSTISIPGWYIKKGYLYVEGKIYAFLNFKNFNEICGSCIIIKPELFDFMIKENGCFRHERVKLNDKQSLIPLPFPGALYSMVNGTNHLLSREGMYNRRTRIKLFKIKSVMTLFRRLSKYILVPKIILKKEFYI